MTVKEYNTGIMELEYETEEQLKILEATYPNDECGDNGPYPPPPKPIDN